MMLARQEDGSRGTATPGSKALCEGCDGPVLAYCGTIQQWHWRHKNGNDCDTWHEPETAWHLDWKAKFPESCCEIWDPPHRADVITHGGMVVEFQNSPIDARDIQERESFWENLIWVFNAVDWFGNFDIRPRPNKITFRWKHPRQSIFAARRPVYLDTGHEIFQITWLSNKVPCGGTGRFIPYRYFVRAILRYEGTGD